MTRPCLKQPKDISFSQMLARLKHLAPIIIFSTLPTVLIWLPFFLRLGKFWTIPLPSDGMATVVSNYDGPLFLVVAKTLYNPNLVGNFPFTLPTAYYTAHFPLFPILIRSLSTLLGYPYAMLATTVISSILSVYFFKLFIENYVDKKDVLWMTFVFSIFPARWLIVRSVGSAEPLFLASIIASINYFNKKKYFWSGVWGAVAMLTKSPAILLFAAYLLTIFISKTKEDINSSFSKFLSKANFYKIASITLIPLALLLIFFLYKIQLNDFWAYFHSGDNIHLFFPPFQIFNYAQPWVNTFWLEEVIFVYLFGILGLIKLIKMKEKTLYWFVGIFFASIIFVSHRDIIRYSLPIVPCLLVAFSETIVKKEFKIALIFLIIPIYLFSLSYISQNVMPIADWAALL